jgi:hypothetical protein
MISDLPLSRYQVSPLRKLMALAVLLVAVSSFIGFARADDLQNQTNTPGVSRSGLTKTKICATKWGKDERHVTDAMKRQVFALYGYSGYSDPHCVADAHGKTCEIDHLISRELGGADDIKNLWPEAYGTLPWNAHLKDTLENRLNKEMCASRITLKQARDMLANDWREAYRKYYGEPVSP